MAEQATFIHLIEAPELNISPIYTGHSWGEGLSLQQFEDDETTPINYTSTYTLAVFRDNARTNKVYSKALITTDNDMPLFHSISENKFRVGGTYYFDIYDDIDINHSHPLVRGTLTVIHSR